MIASGVYQMAIIAHRELAYTDGGLAIASANIPGEAVTIGESRELGKQILRVDRLGRSVNGSLLAEQLSHRSPPTDFF